MIKGAFYNQTKVQRTHFLKMFLTSTWFKLRRSVFAGGSLYRCYLGDVRKVLVVRRRMAFGIYLVGYMNKWMDIWDAGISYLISND